mmetsp:Transcript_47969/g.110319  ORF Transcript_47969/g.110319 Transcript_47969/m.110319 type:complete len:228 (-) Transcript_47969:2149-2832(-)
MPRLLGPRILVCAPSVLVVGRHGVRWLAVICARGCCDGGGHHRAVAGKTLGGREAQIAVALEGELPRAHPAYSLHHLDLELEQHPKRFGLPGGDRAAQLLLAHLQVDLCLRRARHERLRAVISHPRIAHQLQCRWAVCRRLVEHACDQRHQPRVRLCVGREGNGGREDLLSHSRRVHSCERELPESEDVERHAERPHVCHVRRELRVFLQFRARSVRQRHVARGPAF